MSSNARDKFEKICVQWDQWDRSAVRVQNVQRVHMVQRVVVGGSAANIIKPLQPGFARGKRGKPYNRQGGCTILNKLAPLLFEDAYRNPHAVRRVKPENPRGAAPSIFRTFPFEPFAPSEPSRPKGRVQSVPFLTSDSSLLKIVPHYLNVSPLKIRKYQKTH